MSLTRAIAFVLDREKGLVDDPTDPGGLTNWGIALNRHPELTAAQIRSMTAAQAGEIYAGPQYWGAVHGSELPAYLQLPMLDAGVNQGAPTAIKILQRALYVTADGVWGPLTAKAVQVANSTTTLALFTSERIWAYAQDKGWPTDGEGWVKRAVLAALQAT